MINERLAVIDKRNQENVEVNIRRFEQASREGYKPLHGFRGIDLRVNDNSRRWTAQLLSPAANPWAVGAGTARTVHATTPQTFDVLRHEYRAMGMDLVLLESADLMFLTVLRGVDDLLASRPKDRIARIEEAAGKLLAMEGTYITVGAVDRSYRWRFQFPPEVVEGSSFTTNTDVDVIALQSWVDRADGGIRNGRLYFMLYKQQEATDGRWVFLDPNHWFDGKCWAPPTRGKYAP